MKYTHNTTVNYFYNLAETFEHACGVKGARKATDVEVDLNIYDYLGENFSLNIAKQSRSKYGQFFTPKPIVDYLLKSSNYSSNKTMIDLSCGSGRFLLGALEK